MLVICDKMLRLQLSLARRESRLASANTLCATELPTDYNGQAAYELRVIGVRRAGWRRHSTEDRALYKYNGI